MGIAGFDAALELLENYGIEQIENRVVQLRQYAAQRLQEKGCRLLWQPQAELHAGIISFQPPAGNAATFFQKVETEFALSLRDDKCGEKWIRISPHFMNCEDDIDRLAGKI